MVTFFFQHAETEKKKLCFLEIVINLTDQVIEHDILNCHS